MIDLIQINLIKIYQMEQEKPKPQFQINKKFSYVPAFEANSSFLGRMFFIWSHEIIRRGNQKHLEMDDLSDLMPDEEPTENYGIFSRIYYSLDRFRKNKLIVAFWKHIGMTFIASGILAIISNLLQFSGPLMINRILQFLNRAEDDPQPLSNGIIYVCILIGSYLLRTVIMGHSMHKVNKSCITVMNSANSLIYHKILKLSSASRKYLDTGSIMTHINVDVMSFYYFTMMSTFLFSAPAMIITAVVLLVVQVGWIGMIAPVMFAVGMFFQNMITKRGFLLRKDMLQWTDKRTKFVNEYFSGIRIIKYYGWEDLVADKIDEIRVEEIKRNFKQLMYRTAIEVIMNMLPIFSSIIIFGVYSALNGQESLTSAKVFTVLSIFNLISVPMRLVIMTIINFMNAKASLERIDHFFGYEERKFQGLDFDDRNLQVGDIKFCDGLFQWENEDVKKHFKEGEKLKAKKPGDKKKDAKKDDKKDEKTESKKKKRDVVDDEEQKPKKKKKSKKKNKNKMKTEEQKSLSESLLSEKDGSTISQLVSESQSSASSAVVENLDLGSLQIFRGQFVSVIGRVGSGKTTFLYSILGQIDKVKGTMSRRGTLAYIPQVSWLRSATIRDNITFELDFDEEKYNNILKISELEADLEILPGGDMTEIGEKGVNLSGGQKQRISIARALYADADIYLIDDCLSALDPYVGKNIFYNCLKEYLHARGKTIVFVTNAIHFTEETDRIIVMDKGRIVEDDTPEGLKQKQAFENINMEYKKSQAKEEEKKQELERKKSQEEVEPDIEKVKLDDEEEVTDDSKKEKKKEVAALVQAEERMKGSVPIKFYYRFFTGPGGIKAILMFIFVTLAQLSRVFSDWWLGEWGSNSLDLTSNDYIIVYAGISVGVGIMIFLKGWFFASFIVASARVVQKRLIQALLHTPLSWFDVTPTGRIIARATKDQDDLDNNLSFNIQFSAQNLLVLFSSILIISIATPVYLAVAAVSCLVYYKIVGLYMNSSRQLKRLEANNRAPLIGHISETINGTYVIRAFNKTQNFIARFFYFQKAYIVSIVNQNICTRWINIMTDLFSVVTIAATGFFGVISVAVDLGKSSNNLVGLALVWSLQINGIMSFTLRLLADTESCMVSVVRLYEYIDNNPSEKSFQEKRPQKAIWPSQGDYTVDNVSYRYRPELPLVLKKLKFDIKAKEKIGVVGRTGSGKSTLTLGLLRILQMAENDDGTTGLIQLDDENVSEVGLHYLRHNVTIIPQDPTLFTGTIKSNIDPFNKYSDEAIAETLKKVSLWDQIREDEEQDTPIKKKVYSKVDDSGSNFSLGQKQLICMARALIRQPKVLLMDEATASIDEKTDELIQKMIRFEFKDTTVITIAHRLNTIIYYDKILVLERGEIKEYDAPLKLVKDENTFLGRLIRKTGKKYMESIIALAEKGVEQ